MPLSDSINIDDCTIRLFSEEGGLRQSVAACLRDHFSAPDWRQPFLSDCDALRATPDMMEIRLKTQGLKQAVRINRKLSMPLPTPLWLLDGVLLDEALSALEETPDRSFILQTGGCMALFRHEKDDAIPADLAEPFAGLIEDLWPELPCGRWIALSCLGTRVHLPSPGLLSHVVTMASSVSAALILGLAAQRSTIADEGHRSLILAGTGDAVEKVDILKEEQVWSLLSSALSATQSNLTSVREIVQDVQQLLTCQGRGRRLGKLDPARLFRLGISNWR